MVDKIAFLWVGSFMMLASVALQWRLGGKQAGVYTLHLVGVASTYWIGMTLRHFEIGPVFIHYHLPDVGFVVWQTLVYATVVTSIQTVRQPRFVYSFTNYLRILAIVSTVILAVTLLHEFTSSLDWVDVAAYFVGLGLAALPLCWILRRPEPVWRGL